MNDQWSGGGVLVSGQYVVTTGLFTVESRRG